MNNDVPAGHDNRGDDKWNVVFDEGFVQGATVREAPFPAHVPAPAVPGRKRLWPWVAAPVVLAVAATAFLVSRPTGSASDEAGAAGASASAPAPKVSPTTAAAARPVIPLTWAFPDRVGSGAGAFTKVGQAMLKSCTEPDSVGPALAAMINESKGCAGEEVALYKDARNNQFNLAVFTMRDPQDTVKLVTRLSMAFDDYEVAAQAPPPGSSLRTLPPDSGMVQSFTGYGRAMVVGLAQWSDGRTRDYQQLVDRLQPLLGKVSKNVARYENAH